MWSKLFLVACLGVVVGAALGWIGALSDASNSVYQHIYGKSPAHPTGGTVDHLNDWLTFLPSDPLVRGGIVAGAIVALLAVSYVLNFLGIRWSRRKNSKLQAEEAKQRTISAYRVK
jgi:hypothetical protein